MIIVSLIKYFRGYVYVHLTGYAPERFLNLCGNRNILIWNLKPAENGYYFCISVQGYKSLKPILRKTKTRARILERKGLPFLLFRYRKRKAYVLGILFFAGILYYFSGFVWNIEVNGNSYLSEDTIIRFLEEEKASFGTKIKNIDCAKLEETLRSRYDEVIWTSIKIYGTKMTVDVQESLLPDEVYEKQEGEVYDIVASKSGVISEIITRNGTPLVTEGMEVVQGDILVSGRLEIIGDNGEVTQYLYQSADADILARVTYEYTDEINIAYQDKRKTGEVKKDYELQFFGKILKNPFFKKPEGTYDVVTENTQLHFTRNFYLPVYFRTVSYEPYITENKEYTQEEAKAIAEENFRQYLSNLEEKGIQIIEKNVMINRVDQKYVVSGTIDVYEPIVSYQPTEILEITVEEGQQNESD